MMMIVEGTIKPIISLELFLQTIFAIVIQKIFIVTDVVVVGLF